MVHRTRTDDVLMTSDFFTAATMRAVFQDVAPSTVVNLLSFCPEDGGSTSIREVYTRLHGVTSDLQKMNHCRVFSSQNFPARIDANRNTSAGMVPCEHRFEPGTFQMRRIVNYTPRGTEQRQKTEMKEDRKAERYEGQNGIYRQRRHRWASF